MARTLPLLDAAQRREFDSPPKFTTPQRSFFFARPEWAEPLLRAMSAPHMRGGFLLQLGYFKATGRFFPVDRFVAADRTYVQQQLRLDSVDWTRYDVKAAFRHWPLVLHHLGILPFEQVASVALAQVTHFARQQMNPTAVFRSAVDYLRAHRWEVPSYATLAGVVTEAFRAVEQQVTARLAQHLTPALCAQLDALFATEDAAPAERNRPYRLTTLKRTLELMRPAAIRTNVQDYIVLKALFVQLQPLVQALDLSEDMIRYYARYVERAQVFQVRQQSEKKYLMLLCFLVYQYYQVGDLLTETLQQAVQTHRNAAQREHQARVYRQQQDTAGQLRQVLDGVIGHGAALQQLEAVAFSFAQTNEQKVEALLAWLQTPDVAAFAQLRHAAQQLRKAGGGSTTGPYYQVVEERSRALQRRLGDILRLVEYEGPADSPLAQALASFRDRAGQLNNKLPVAFLKAAERAALEQASSPVSLYKALLAGHVADHLKAGKLNLLHSLSFRPFDTYLLDELTWTQQREQLLEKTNLTHLREAGPWLDALQTRLAAAFTHTVERLQAGTNPGVRRRADGRPHFVTPARPVDAEALVEAPLFPGPGSISLHEVLHTVNAQCRFTDCLQHWSVRNRPPRPADRLFFAAVMAYGCNLGLPRMAHATRHVSQATLENTVNWYFSLDNLRKANDAVVALIGKLPVSRLFRRHPDQTHTSSDGQKYYVAVDSIHATHSYKYFGQEKGLVSYNFLDDRHRLFYSVTFSSSEREAPYMIDGLLHNDVVESTLHSTDTHGFTEVNFALTEFIAVAFAPRIQSFQEQQLYAFAGMDVPDVAAFGLRLGKPLDRAVIEAQWETILRLVVSLKQKHVTASTLLKRLNSYSQQHPVYVALREVGRAVRTEFLLRYMDDQELRKRIDDQLDKLESTHQFARAVFYGQNGQLHYAGKEEQQVADTCKRLVQNVIVCWNCLYLNQQLFQAPPAERQALANAIACRSPVSWQHVNLQGEFDFSEEALTDALHFDLEALLTVEWDVKAPSSEL
ncbi:Tn3 family transposase [Hymenobacter psychrotolerans]|uniref:Transposase and inactivated derivatives, TnpA family n=1 Tax=Hymenobacter psychrotolerans DSM 18569 TaxID=1121959 RepID=A0A1M7H6S6_9BACT|nr:Tn3 family transposase [Hymenobacter psychrotolerans]SHM24284.1 Transposase and inactivated derivatives, TnpA family [Hymenobacter psychrotolerans DSM 18569]